jgi:hypothetical protein
MKEAEDRFCIVINGDSRTGKSKLADLIVKTLAKTGLIHNENSSVWWKQQELSDKLPRLLGKEVVVLDDYDGENHRFGVFDALTGEQTSNIRIMGNYESTRYVKGAIIPTVDMVETWVTAKTGSLIKFQQIYFRAECNLYIFERKDTKNPTWEDYRNRVFYIGNVRRWVYKTLMVT